MISNIFVFTNVIIFVLISMLHFYWAFGGSWGYKAAIPEKFQEVHFKPSNKLKTAIATIIVALGLMLFAVITLFNSNLLVHEIPPTYIHYATGIIGSIFLIRGIGDMNMFGLFKKKSDSTFAKYDSKIYTPLCLFIATLSLLIII